MFDSHGVFSYSLVQTAPSPAGSGTSLVVTAGQGTRFPTPPFNMTIAPIGAIPTLDNAEIVRVTLIVTDTFTITRAQEGTSARTIVVGDQCFNAISVKTFTDIETRMPQAGKVTAMPTGTDVTFDPSFSSADDYAVSVYGRDLSGAVVNVAVVKASTKITLVPDIDSTIVDWTVTPKTQ